MNLPNSKELAQKIASGDELSFKSLFLSCHASLMSFAVSILHVRPLAEEVVSDVFLNIWQNKSRLLEIENLSLYLYVSVRNRSLNALEKLRRERTVWIEETAVEFRSFSEDPVQNLLTAENLREIKKAVASLPPKCGLIFKLIKEDGLSYKETAELLELSVKTIENQMGIALKKLSEAIPSELHHRSKK